MHGLRGYHKLLVIPLLLAHYRHSKTVQSGHLEIFVLRHGALRSVVADVVPGSGANMGAWRRSTSVSS